MKKFEKKNQSKVINILSESFKENKSVKYVLRNPNRINYLMKYSVKKCLLNGEIWTNDDISCCVLVIEPKKKSSWMKNILLDLYLVINVLPIKSIGNILKKENDLKEHHPKNEDFLHLWYIGVDPNKQGQGLGSKILNEVIDYYKNKYYSICLETSTLRNISFYKNLNFEIYDTLDYGFDYHLFKIKL